MVERFKRKSFGANKDKQGEESAQPPETATTAEEQGSDLDNDSKVRLSADISKDNHRKLRMAAADRYITIAQVVDELIERNL